MTEASAPNPRRTPKEVSSNPLLRTTLLWSAVVTAGLAIVGAIIGYAVAGTSGLWSALVAVLLAAVFLGTGQRGPAGLHEGLVGVAEAGRGGDSPSLPAAADFIPLARQRRHHLGHELARLVQHLLHQRLVGLGQPLQGLQLHRCLQHVEEQETGVGEGGLVRHSLLSKTELYAEVFPARGALFV